MKEAWLAVTGRRVRYVESGHGAPIVFAAGLGITADFYQPNLRAFAHAGFRAIAPDLPGFGKTRGPFWGANIPSLTQFLADFCAALRVEHAGWIGHSLGCQPLLHLAVQQPQLVRAFVLAGPTGGYEHRLRNQITALAAAAVQEPWRVLKAVLRDYVRLSPFNYLGTWLKARYDDPLRPAAAARQPALVLVGTKDKVPRREFITNLATRLRAEVVYLPGGNHALPLDAEADFERSCIQFFRRHLS